MKYDALHNRQFLETMFNPGEENLEKSNTNNEPNGEKEGSNAGKPTQLPKLRELYKLAKILFEYVLLSSALITAL
jgi:hypothetical protein